MGLDTSKLNERLRRRIQEQIERDDCARDKVSDAKQCERPVALEADSKTEAPSAGCPLVRFRLCRVKLLDVDAKYASVKDLLDGLSNAGLIHGDKEGQIRLEVQQERVATYASEQTVIEIEIL